MEALALQQDVQPTIGEQVNDDTIPGEDRLGQKCVDEGGLPGAGSAGDEGVLSLLQRIADEVCLLHGQDIVRDVVGKGEDDGRALAKGEAQHALLALPPRWWSRTSGSHPISLMIARSSLPR